MKIVLTSLFLFSACSGITPDMQIMRVKPDTTDNISIRVDTTVKEYMINLNLNEYGSDQ